MRLGLMVRMDNRGLGIQSWELYRHLEPDVTVAISMRRNGYGEHPDRFPDAINVLYGGLHLKPYDIVLKVLSSCDVVLMLETPYDWRLLTDLPARGTKTVIVGNRELLQWSVRPDLPTPDVFVAPSPWRLSEWPVNTVHIPHPVDRQRLPFRLRDQARVFLHIAAPAMMDRSGTVILDGAIEHLQPGLEVVVKSQGRPVSPREGLRVEVADIDNYWDLYKEADVLVAPRRYGGQSLPVNEAMSSGMPVIALDREPDRSMVPQETLVPATRDPKATLMIGGQFHRWDADSRDLATVMNRLASDPDLMERMSRDSNRRADELSWGTLGPRWEETLETVASQ